MEQVLAAAAEITWKTSAKEILQKLRCHYGKMYDNLEQQNLDTLADNYAEARQDEFLDALGQELSCSGYRLYFIRKEEIASSFLLVIIDLQYKDDFRITLIDHGLAATRCHQDKDGIPAYRFDLSQKLHYKVYEVPKGWNLLVGQCKDDLLVQETVTVDGMEKVICKFLSLHEETFLQFHGRIEAEVMAITQSPQGVFAAIVYKDKNGSIARRPAKIQVGSDLDKIGEWPILGWLDQYYWGDEIAWFHDDLFIGHSSSFYRIENAANGGTTLEKLSLDRGHCKQSIVSTKDKLYLVGKNVYEWKEDWVEQCYQFDEAFYISAALCVGDSKIACMLIPKRGQVKVAIVDTVSKTSRAFSCYGVGMTRWKNNRIFTHSYEIDEDGTMLQCYDLDTNTWRCLKVGTIGWDTPKLIFETSEGKTCIMGDKTSHLEENVQASKKMYVTEQLWEDMESCGDIPYEM